MQRIFLTPMPFSLSQGFLRYGLAKPIKDLWNTLYSHPAGISCLGLRDMETYKTAGIEDFTSCLANPVSQTRISKVFLP
jgi:hypothetical protein